MVSSLYCFSPLLAIALFFLAHCPSTLQAQAFGKPNWDHPGQLSQLHSSSNLVEHARHRRSLASGRWGLRPGKRSWTDSAVFDQRQLPTLYSPTYGLVYDGEIIGGPTRDELRQNEQLARLLALN